MRGQGRRDKGVSLRSRDVFVSSRESREFTRGRQNGTKRCSVQNGERAEDRDSFAFVKFGPDNRIAAFAD